MERLQFGLFYEEFSSADLCKVVCLTNKISHCSIIIALFYLFLLLFLPLGQLVIFSNWGIIHLQSPLFPTVWWISGQAKVSAEFSLNSWSIFPKMIQWLNFCGHFYKKTPLAPLLAWLWAGLQHKLQHFFFTVLCVTSKDLQAYPASRPFAYFRGCGL